jgi:uncharacterized membrane protein YgcG
MVSLDGPPTILGHPTNRNRIALSIFVIEIFTVFIPCWQVQKHQNLRQETLESIANWESKKRFATKESASDKSSAPPLSPTSTKVGDYTGFDSWKKLPNLESNTSQPNLVGIPDESVLTMAALEHVLDKNPEPLRQFSARRDFSGENIAFLTAVAEWKAALPTDFTRSRYETTPETVREQFTRALRIYTEFISPRDAEFPINIAWPDLRKLQGIFERAARSTAAANPSSSSPLDSVTPFADDAHLPAYPAATQPPTDPTTTPTPAPTRPRSRESELHILSPSTSYPKSHHSTSSETPPPKPPPQTHTPLHITFPPPPSAATTTTTTHPLHTTYTGDIPQSFDATVFDAAQASIKYLVLTNTWPKYVRERRSSESSSSSNSGQSEHGGGGSHRGGGGGGGSGGASTVGGRSDGSRVSNGLRGALWFLRGVIVLL